MANEHHPLVNEVNRGCLPVGIADRSAEGGSVVAMPSVLAIPMGQVIAVRRRERRGQHFLNLGEARRKFIPDGSRHQLLCNRSFPT